MIKRGHYLVMLSALLLIASSMATQWVMAAPEHQAEAPAEPISASSTQWVWQQLTPANTGPGPRFDHAMVYNASTNKLFLFGGRNDNPSNQSFNDVWTLDLDNLTWQELATDSPTRPGSRHSAVMIVDAAGQYLYVAAGQIGTGQRYDDIWRLNLATETWENLTASAGAPPQARYAAGGGNINGNLIISHGFADARYDDTWIFNTATNKWQNIIPLDAPGVPLKRCLLASTTAGDELVIHGGCSSGVPGGICPQNDTWILDTTTASPTWRQVTGSPKPSAREYHSLAYFADLNQVVLFGGDASSNKTQPRNDLWLLDLAAETWQSISAPNGPSARFSHAAVWIPETNNLDSGMIVYGGTPTGNNNSGLADLWLLTLRLPGALQFNASDYSVIENEGGAVITVTRTGGLSGTVTVDYGTSNGGTATIGSDYQVVSGTLTFTEGEAIQTFQVPIIDGAPPPDEGDETINLVLNNPGGGATLGTPDTAVLTIFDDDGPGRVQFDTAGYQVVENGASAIITVTRIAGSSGQVSVTYETGSGTATAGTDYTAISGTLTFTDGDTVPKAFTIAILDDDQAEGNETVEMTLSNPTGGVILGSPNPATLSILDDDGADLALTQVSQPNSVLLGQLLTYTILVRNNGPAPATGVIMTDTLPASATFSSALVTQGSCDETNGTVTCDLGELDPNTQITTTLVVTPAEVGLLVNHAQVIAQEADPNPANNASVLSTTVTLVQEARSLYLPAIIKTP